LNFVITDWDEFRSIALGLAVAHALRSLYRDEWQAEPYDRLLGNAALFRRLLAGEKVESLLSMIDRQTTEFRARRQPFLLYQ
jgi:hypothetical protein